MNARAKWITGFGLVTCPAVVVYAPVWPEAVGALLAAALVLVKPGRPIAELGLTRPVNAARVAAIGVAAGIALVLANRLLLAPFVELVTGASRDLGKFNYLRGDSAALSALLPMVWFLAAFCEEVVYRGYLLSQAAELLGNSRLACGAASLFSATLFGLAHGYQGTAGVILTTIVAVLMGGLFLWQRRNLWANVLAHGIADTLSLTAISLSWDHGLDAAGRALWPNS